MPKIEKNASTGDTEPDSQSARSKYMRMLPWILVALVLVAAVVFAGIQHKKAKSLDAQLSQLKANPQQVAEDQTKAIIDKVGQLIILPKDEQPTLATVTDLAALKDQPFFAQAELGDKVLIYTNAKKAILYSEKLNRIKEVAPVNIGDNGDTLPTPTTTKSGSSAKQVNANSNTNSNSNSAANSNRTGNSNQ
jgi:hypothetical protein